jgi:hypothetical protein
MFQALNQIKCLYLHVKIYYSLIYLHILALRNCISTCENISFNYYEEKETSIIFDCVRIIVVHSSAISDNVRKASVYCYIYKFGHVRIA